MATLRSAPLWLSVLALGLSVGCYTRAELRQKATPPASRIFVQVEVDGGLVKAHAASQQEFLDEADKEALKGVPRPPSSESVFEVLGASLTATIKSDLVRNKLGFVVLDPEAEADLKLLGRLRQDPMSGAALDWQLIESRTGVVVQAGVATSGFLNAEQFSDQILQDLLSIDVDQYAAAGTSAPRPAGEAGGGGGLKARASGTDGRRSFAVIVGVESYREALPAATHAEDDARAFAEFAEVTLGVPPEHIRLLVGDRAGRADLASAVEEWLPRNVREPGATVYFFFSGHGAPDVETGDAYLVPYDADPAFLKTRGYALSHLYERLGALPDARTFAFIDACFSGVGDRSVLASGTRPLVPVKAAKAPGSLIAFSAASASEATGVAADAPHGLFTLHLLSGLSGRADANGDDDVTLDEIVAHVTEQVTRAARLQNRDQTPSLTNPARLNPKSVVVVRQLSP